jgi:hypothetical protein
MIATLYIFIAHNSQRYNSPQAQFIIGTMHRDTIHRGQFSVHNSPRTIYRAQFPHTVRRSTIHRAKLFITKNKKIC